MKFTKTISALTMGLGFAFASQAQDGSQVGTAVYITGSTAFRGQIYNALGDLGLTVISGGASSHNSFTFSGTVADTHGTVLGLATNAPGLSGTAVTVYCTFSGSVEGISALTSLTSATYTNVDGTSFTHGGADLAFSDVAQSSTSIPSPALQEAQLLHDKTNNGGIPGTGVAVQPFGFFASKGAIGAKNITAQNFSDLFHGGKQDLSFYSGVASDSNITVYAVGRYNLSGTRITTILDDGAKLTTALAQYALSADGTTTPGLASTDSASPPSVSNEQWLYVTNNGYFTGGNVGNAIHSASVNYSTGNPLAAIGYLGFSDANSKLTTAAGDIALNWNGQAPGTIGGPWAIAPTENGSYSFWSYERLYVLPTDDGTFYQNTFAPGLISALQYEIVNASPVTAVLESQMNVYRNADGGDVFHF